MISVLLVDDHPVVIEGLRKLLAASGDIDVTGEAHDAAGALEQAKKLRPDVILLDLRMPGASGVQVTRRLREQESPSAVIILTSYGDQAYVRQALEAGADGYLLKNTAPDHLIAAIRSAVRGRRQISPELLDGVLSEFGGLAREQTRREADLSEDDREILRLASQGATNREIGLATGRTEIAIKKRLQSIFLKLGAVDRAHAVAESIRRGLI
jgi:DNA-binding NarL/FixJ family response regulator